MTARVRTVSVSHAPPTLFRTLLISSMRDGIRPVGDPKQGQLWTYNTLSEIVGTSARTVGNWCRGDTLPADIRSLVRAFYGPENDGAYKNRRWELYKAFEAAKMARNAPTAYQKRFLEHKQLFVTTKVAELSAAISGSVAASVMVVGPQGTGKTTLAQQIAANEHVLARFGQRRWLVELATVTNAVDLRIAIIQAIGLNPAVTRFHGALRRLGRKPALLILDDLETSWKRDTGAVQECLQQLASHSTISLLASLRSYKAISSPAFTREILLGGRSGQL